MIPAFVEARMRAWSPRFSPKLFKVVLISLFALALSLPLAFVALPYLELLNDMAVQPKGKAQGVYGTLLGEHHTVARRAVEGSVHMAYASYPYPGDGDDVIEAAAVGLINPVVPTMAVLEEGQKLFNRYCITCHGEEGDGDGPIVGPDLFPAPPSLHTETAREFKDGRIFHVITRGQDPMPDYADKLSARERWSTVHYVRALQRARNPRPEDLNR
jgi:mono/diheme cytochrome c family protein